VRQYRLHVEEIHALFDAALHPDQTETELIFQQFADRPDPPISQVVDVVDFSFPHFEVHEVADDFDDILRSERPLFERQVEQQLLVEFQSSDRREIVPLGVQKQIVE
jgi:hypothetical protein